MSLNKRLMDEYKAETGDPAIYKVNGITRHFLDYVDWLEDKLTASKTTVQQPVNEIKVLVNQALTTDGAHHKRWYLEGIAILLHSPMPEHEKGIAP